MAAFTDGAIGHRGKVEIKVRIGLLAGRVAYPESLSPVRLNCPFRNDVCPESFLDA